MSNDQEIINLVLSGNLAAFGLLVRRYQNAVLCMTNNMIRDRHEAEDLGQDVFVAAFQNLHKYEPGRCMFSTWLLTIARNKCINQMRKKRPHPMAELPQVPGGPTPHDNLENNELLEHLDRALADLPENQKTAFVLTEFVGLAADEVSFIEGVEAGTIRSRLSRAKAALRSSLSRFVGVDQ
jgi:RNA polymerase sigma-70 factor (ECF subfamily)